MESEYQVGTCITFNVELESIKPIAIFNSNEQGDVGYDKDSILSTPRINFVPLPSHKDIVDTSISISPREDDEGIDALLVDDNYFNIEVLKDLIEE